MSRYNHPFWNSWFMDRVEHFVVKVNNYIWRKKYGKN